MRIDRLQHGLRKTRKFRFQLQLHARGEERKTLQQALNERIRTNLLRLPVQSQPAGDFRKLLCKLRTHLPQMR